MLSSYQSIDFTWEKCRGFGTHILQSWWGSEEWLKTFWSLDQCNPLEWMCVSKSGEQKVLRLSGGSICYSAMLLNHVALTVSQKWVLVLSFCQSMYPTFLGRGGKVILLSLILFYLLMDHLKSITLHSTLRPVIGWLRFHLWEEIKSDSRQMLSIVSTMTCFIWYPLVRYQLVEICLMLLNKHFL